VPKPSSEPAVLGQGLGGAPALAPGHSYMASAVVTSFEPGAHGATDTHWDEPLLVPRTVTVTQVGTLSGDV
jgi:hypothetical protein